MMYIRLNFLWLLFFIHLFGSSSVSKPHINGIDVICTGNKDNTGSCTSSNNADGSSKLLACTIISSDLIECSRMSAGLLVHYDCVKSLSISNYQKLFSCQENPSSGNVDVDPFVADKDDSGVLNSDHDNKRFLVEGNPDRSSVDSTSKIFIDAINMNVIDIDTRSPSSGARDSFASEF